MRSTTVSRMCVVQPLDVASQASGTVSAEGGCMRTQAVDRSMGPIGGQALLEGVMMRRGECWGAAVRRPDGSIALTHQALPPALARWRGVPLVRGVLALGESTVLGTRATTWAARERADGEGGDGYSQSGLIAAAVVAAALALGLFGLLPAVTIKAFGVRQPVLFSLGEGALRLALLIDYLLLLGRSPQVQRVFGYHGAEHMTIHAFEHRVLLEPAAIRAFDRRHPRCGTSFLLLVVGITVLTHVLIGTPTWPVLIASRLLGLPLVAGLAYEAIRFAGLHQDRWFGRMVMAPGFWLQGLTTREPDDDMIEVAVAARDATLAAERRPVSVAA